ncbi:uncharacterized protein C19orf47 [Adelges cooleyi]|uniref:uncharacterized protein C19orf47 n=1 Tax=Adelges cooleyi TaxID=133065 RepID=UPI00218072B2|nr:uncharacterized protein C19orf47 [Adelges cooleyi]
MSTFSKEWWIKFFTDTGIPTFASSKYATIFHENRIQSNMLMDLDKDILKEMGITVIGDIIAILKHAKDVYREGFYGNNGNEISVSKSNSSVNNETVPQKKKSVANKVKKVIVKKVKVSSESEYEEDTLPIKTVKRIVPSQPPTKIIVRKVVSKTKSTPLKIKPVVLNSDDDDSPSPTELKTKSSVFDRLGVGDVSSTTPNLDNASTSESRKSSVFNRLGKKQNHELTTVPSKRSAPVSVCYGPSIPSEESSALTKRIKNEVSNSSSSKSVFERIGASCDNLKKSPGLVSKSALLRNANTTATGRPIHVNPKVLNVNKLSQLNRSHFRSCD